MITRTKTTTTEASQRIDDAYKGSDMTTDAAADRRQARWIGKYNGVLIFLAIWLLTVTLSRLCIFTV